MAMSRRQPRWVQHYQRSHRPIRNRKSRDIRIWDSFAKVPKAGATISRRRVPAHCLAERRRSMDPDDKNWNDRHIGRSAALASGAPPIDDDQPIVDAHHHLWDLEGNVRYPWLKQADPHHAYMGDNSAL